jgi:DNA-binding PadR family transcriptional regulator
MEQAGGKLKGVVLCPTLRAFASSREIKPPACRTFNVLMRSRKDAKTQRTMGLEIFFSRYILNIFKRLKKEFAMFFGYREWCQPMQMGFGRGLGRHGRFGARQGRGGGRRRVFDGAALRLILLSLIEQQPRHGYDLIREIEELSGGAYAPSPGVVYPTLTMLSEMGLIEEVEAEGSRKQFSLTEAGSAHLAENHGTVEQLLDRLRRLGSDGESADHAPIARALDNLTAVLRHRLSREDTSVNSIHDAAALIDEVAQKIERM